MESEKRKFELERTENEIVFSKSIKAGKRIYYLDVKRSKNNDLFLSITESKKKVTGTEDDLQVTYEKHKIFLYKEDLDKFVEGIDEVVTFIKQEQPEQPEEAQEPLQNDSENKKEEGKSQSFFDKFKF